MCYARRAVSIETRRVIRIIFIGALYDGAACDADIVHGRETDVGADTEVSAEGEGELKLLRP